MLEMCLCFASCPLVLELYVILGREALRSESECFETSKGTGASNPTRHGRKSRSLAFGTSIPGGPAVYYQPRQSHLRAILLPCASHAVILLSRHFSQANKHESTQSTHSSHLLSSLYPTLGIYASVLQASLPLLHIQSVDRRFVHPFRWSGSGPLL